MKKVVALILLFSLNAAAAEVTKFEPRPAAVEQEGDTYVGILLSEEDFRKILEKKIDTNAKLSECSVDKRVCSKAEQIYKSSIIKLEDPETIKKYEINFDKSPEKLQISKIKGVSNLNIDKNIVTFSMQGNVDNLIKSLAKYKVNNLRIIEPDLEEIFLTYY